MKKFNLLLALTALTFWSCNQDNELNQVDKNLSSTYDKGVQTCTELTSFQSDNSTVTQRGTLTTNSKWTSGQIIRIKFLNGDNILQEKVKQYANYWTTLANIKFQYVLANENADIKIGFKWNNDGDSWSHVGIGGKFVSQTEPSMNFGFDTNTAETTINSLVLHEFGHVLGLVHEHQSPAGNIPWDKPKVYEYYKSKGWSVEDVDSNIFTKYSLTTTNYTAYDNLSIMHYPISSSLTTNGYSVAYNYNLSVTDKTFIEKMYPKSNLYPYEMLNSSRKITSPNGRFYLTIRSGKLIIYDDAQSKVIWSLSPNIKFSNFYSTDIYCQLRGSELLLFKGSVSRYVLGDTSLIYGNYVTIKDSGDIELIKNGVAVWSLFRGKLI